MPTPHIAASDGDIAPFVLMPGDPRRATLIAERFFDEPRLVTQVRGILGYTGTFEGRPVSVMASGMGMPSISIYATELARHYGVTRIIRVGTMGGLQADLGLGDVVAASAAHTDSAMTQRRIPGINYSHAPSFALLRGAVEHAEASGTALRVGPVFTSDAFYSDDPATRDLLVTYGTLAVEMEAAGLYAVAAEHGIEALMIGTVSDHLFREESMTADERETTFVDMVSIALGALFS